MICIPIGSPLESVPTGTLIPGSPARFAEIDLSLVQYAIPAYYVIASAEASSNLSRFDGVKYGWRAAEYDGLTDLYRKTRTQGFGAEVKRPAQRRSPPRPGTGGRSGPGRRRRR